MLIINIFPFFEPFIKNKVIKDPFSPPQYSITYIKHYTTKS